MDLTDRIEHGSRQLIISPARRRVDAAQSAALIELLRWDSFVCPKSATCSWFDHVEVREVHGNDDSLPRALASMLRSNSTVTSLAIDDVSIPGKVFSDLEWHVVSASADRGVGGE